MSSHERTSDGHRDLVDAATRGEPPALERLLERHLPALQAFVRRRQGMLVADRESVDDIVQSSCREALQHVDRFVYTTEHAFVAWLHEVALSKIISRLRYHQRQRRDVGREERLDAEPVSRGDVYATFASPSEHAQARELEGRIAVAYDQLSEEHQRVVFLARLMGWSHDDIAGEMGRSVEATRALLHRAIARLGLLLGMDRDGADAPRA